MVGLCDFCVWKEGLDASPRACYVKHLRIGAVGCEHRCRCCMRGCGESSGAQRLCVDQHWGGSACIPCKHR